MRKKRYFKKKEKELKGTGYDSFFEKNLHEAKLKPCRFHDPSDKLKYIVEHTYEPDFVYELNGRTYLIELKGRFRDSAEMSKYVWINKVLNENTELVFVWEKEGTALPFSKKRKDGTRRSNEEWAEKNGFRHWHQETFDLNLL